MPVLLKEVVGTTHVNPTLVLGGVYRVVAGYAKDQAFVVFPRGPGVKGVQYLGCTVHNGWDLAEALSASRYVEITLQEV